MSQYIVGDRWIRGWDAILKFAGGYKTNKVIIRLSKDCGFPLRHMPSGEPIVIMSEANEWLRTFSEASSPFRLRKLSGAILSATKGDLKGAAATAKVRGEAMTESKMQRLRVPADFSGRPKGTPPPDGPISPFKTF